jgi:uncharacterized protein YdaU (DUF1376 family)
MSELRPLPYYKWFWQDWRANRKAQRMSYIERGLYRELLDECWVEGFIPNDISTLAEICGCPNEVMANAWQVLESCFELIDNKYINKKMESMRTEKDTERLIKSLNGKKGGDSKSLNNKPKKASAKQVLASANQVQASANIEEKRREEKSINTPEGVSHEVFNDFLKLRKGLKAPVTQTAIKGLAKEAQIAKMSLEQVMVLCCQNGWRGFKAEWMPKEKEDIFTQHRGFI